ncbi:DNA sulfur modification protein DndB [Microbacterium sp. NPDC078428]|uniref:DNA sulfur modification protein DndB n=1 Tax=Microbacterium sp. NPDC078428 TaxID=3364190 RepID=UPI0037C9A52C
MTVTLEQVAAAAEGRLIWTDQSVQRGILPTARKGVATELPLSDGYPDRETYIFDAENADEMAEKILRGERLFLNPLVWNLRPGKFEAYWDETNRRIDIYDGKIFLPDSHHRHQAILKAVRSYRDHRSGFPRFDLNRQFKVELYFLDREDEGNYFFDKNQRPKPTALSKAYDLTTEDDLSTLAKRVLDLNPNLDAGTNRVTDRLSKKAENFVTLSTLREVMKTYAGHSEVEETQLDGLAAVAAEFFDMLAGVRPELRVETPQTHRETTLASQAVMMHGYAALMQDYATDRAKLGSVRARRLWEKRLEALAPDSAYSHGEWRGDVLSRDNPLWREVGVVQVRPETGAVSIANNGGTRARTGAALRQHVRAVVPDRD